MKLKSGAFFWWFGRSGTLIFIFTARAEDCALRRKSDIFIYSATRGPGLILVPSLGHPLMPPSREENVDGEDQRIFEPSGLELNRQLGAQGPIPKQYCPLSN
jgi:hypothetical protein